MSVTIHHSNLPDAPENNPHDAVVVWAGSVTCILGTYDSPAAALGAVVMEIQRASIYVGEPISAAGILDMLNEPGAYEMEWAVVPAP